MTTILRRIALVLIGLTLVVAAFQAAQRQLVVTRAHGITMVAVLLWIGIDHMLLRNAPSHRTAYSTVSLVVCVVVSWLVAVALS